MIKLKEQMFEKRRGGEIVDNQIHILKENINL